MVQFSHWNIWCAITLLVGCSAAGTHLNYQDQGVYCDLVSYDNKREASIGLRVDQLKLKDEKLADTLKIPALILRYAHATNFSNMVSIEQFGKEYSAKKDLIPVKENKFDLKLADSSDKVDESKIFNGYLTKKDGAHFKVKESGVYCVYIEPPTDVGISDLTIPIRITNSHGYLEYLKYVPYSQNKYGILIGLALTGFLFHYIVKNKLGENFQNLNEISLISKGVILFALIPFVITLIINTIVSFLSNTFSPSDSPSRLLTFFALGSNYISNIYGNFSNYLLLIFSMGFGVIYYHKGSSRNYRKFPARLNKISLYLLIISTVLTTAIFFVILLSGNGDLDNAFMATDSNSLVSNVLMPLASAYYLVWFGFTFVYYFKTKKILSKFPPVDPNDGSAPEKNSKTISSFRRSILFIFLLPLVSMLVFIGLYAYRLYNFTFASNDLGMLNPDSSLLQYSVFSVKTMEMVLFDKLYLIGGQWLGYLNVYFTIIAVYFFWIKDNNGLVIDSPPDYDEVSRFDISDDEEAEPERL